MIKAYSFFRDLMTIGILITSLVPETSNKMVFLPLVLAWFLFAFQSNSRSIIVTFIKPSLKTYSIYLWIIGYMVFYFFGYTSGFEVYIFNYIRIAFSILLINYYIELKNYSTLNRLAIISIFIICFVCITTIKALLIDKNAARLLSTGVESLTENIQGIVGSFGFIYGLVFICITIIGCFAENIIIKHKAIWIIILVLMLFTIYEASFMIALIVLFVISLLIVLKINKLRDFLILCLAVLLILLVCSPIISNILLFLSRNVKGFELSMRVYELSQFITSGNTENAVDMGKRLSLYSISVKSFLSNPLLGVGGFYGYDSAYFGIGGHSGLLDELARYGILGTLPLFIGLIENMKYVYKKLITKKKIIYLKCMIGFFILGFINTVFFVPLIIIVFFVAPAILFYFRNSKESNVL